MKWIYFFASNSLTFLASASPLRFFAIIVPDSSSKKLAGIELTAYNFAASLLQYFRSETCDQVSWSFSIAFSQSSFYGPAKCPKHQTLWFCIRCKPSKHWDSLHGRGHTMPTRNRSKAIWNKRNHSSTFPNFRLWTEAVFYSFPMLLRLNIYHYR